MEFEESQLRIERAKDNVKEAMRSIRNALAQLSPVIAAHANWPNERAEDILSGFSTLVSTQVDLNKILKKLP